MASKLEELILRLTGYTRYHRMYPSTVQSQSEDGATVDLLPDDDAIRGDGLQAVELWHGLPGMVVKVPKGARVMLGFRDGKPDQRYAALWEPGQIESISFGGGTRPIARQGDAGKMYLPAFNATLTSATPPGVFTGLVVLPQPAYVIIGDGNQKVRA